MKTRILMALAALAITTTATAQSAIDAYNLTPTQLRGTARFIGMGGAFTSLGGDLTSLAQNPAGLGIYRHNDIGFTFDLSFRNYKSTTNTGDESENETQLKFDNFGYVGTIKLNGAMEFMQWGVGYNRVASFDRITSGYNRPIGTSLSNYIAGYTNGVASGNLLDDGSSYDPYFNSSEDWLSIIAYNGFMINNLGNSDTQYAGLYQEGTVSDAMYHYRERGYTDEYNFSVAGNVSDVVYWGLGVGVVDLNYSREGYYSESMSDALVYSRKTDRLVNGKAEYGLYNNQYITGSGANIKLGLILRPVDMLRIGVAVHTPTWLKLDHTGYADLDYDYTPSGETSDRPANSGTASTPYSEYSSRLSTPWRFMVGASVTIGSSAIVSVDYERVAYNDMSMKQQKYTKDGYFLGGYTDNKLANADIKDYFKASNIVRVGAEYRINRSFSVRAGYNYQSTNVQDAAANTTGLMQIYTSGTDASYRFDNDTQNICLGFGYRYKSWYLDVAYQHTRQSATYHAFTPFDGTPTPSADITDTQNNVVVSTGFRF